MVEGSQIDWGGHDNDLGYAVSELLAFDEAGAGGSRAGSRPAGSAPRRRCCSCSPTTTPAGWR